jgi:hypothetical protein
MIGRARTRAIRLAGAFRMPGVAPAGAAPTRQGCRRKAAQPPVAIADFFVASGACRNFAAVQ